MQGRPSIAYWQQQWTPSIIISHGIIACRFGKLLQTNSVVLKEESPWIEFYYRSVHAGRHFYAFNRDNITQVASACIHASATRCLLRSFQPQMSWAAFLVPIGAGSSQP